MTTPDHDAATAPGPTAHFPDDRPSTSSIVAAHAAPTRSRGDRGRPAANGAGLDTDPAELDRLIAAPADRAGPEGDDGPLVVMAPRPWSPPAAVAPALLVTALAVGLIAYRAVVVSDWQGLLTEGQQRLLARADHSASRPVEAPPAPADATAEASQVEADDPPPPALEPPRGDLPEPTPPESELLAGTEVADAGTAAAGPEPTGTDAATDAEPASAPEPERPSVEGSSPEDIQAEAERRRAEREELARLKERIEAEAPPPRQADPRRDQAQMLGMIRELQRRQLEAMDQALRELEQQQAEWIDRALRDFVPFLGVPPGLDGDDPSFSPMRRRHAEARERAERDMRRLRERMLRADPFGRPPLAGVVPPPPRPVPVPPRPIPVPPRPQSGLAPNSGGGPDDIPPPDLIVPEGAEVRTFVGPDGSRGIIMRWGWPPPAGGR